MFGRAVWSRLGASSCHQKLWTPDRMESMGIVRSDHLYSTCKSNVSPPLGHVRPGTGTNQPCPHVDTCTYRRPHLQACTHGRRCSSTGSLNKPVVSLGLWTRVKYALGIKPKARYSKHVLRVSGFKTFMCCAELIDYEEFFEVFHMADTFYSWFLIMELHVWLCMVRLAQEGSEGKVVRNMLVEAMWKDVEERAKLLGGVSASARKEAIDELSGHFRASLFSYDEGLLSEDRVLAGAIWRVFFQKEDVDPRHLALMVEYIRKQVELLDRMDIRLMLSRGLVTFQPLRDDIKNTSRNREILNKIEQKEVKPKL